MPTKVRRAVAPHKVLRQVERSAMKDLNFLLLRGRKAMRRIIEDSSPDPTQTTLAGSQSRLEKGIQHSPSDAMGLEIVQPRPKEVTQAEEALNKRWKAVTEWGKATNGVLS